MVITVAEINLKIRMMQSSGIQQLRIIVFLTFPVQLQQFWPLNRFKFEHFLFS